MNETLVLGIGNTLLSDEGVGIHAMRYLKDHYELPGVRYLDGGTLSFALAGDVGGAARLLVIDAAEFHAAPGTVRVLEGSEVDAYLVGGRRSVHEVGLADLFDIARLEGRLPRDYALIGIQPANLDWGDELDPPVRRAVPRAAAEAASLIGRWSRQPGVVGL